MPIRLHQRKTVGEQHIAAPFAVPGTMVASQPSHCANSDDWRCPRSTMATCSALAQQSKLMEARQDKQAISKCLLRPHLHVIANIVTNC